MTLLSKGVLHTEVAKTFCTTGMTDCVKTVKTAGSKYRESKDILRNGVERIFIYLFALVYIYLIEAVMTSMLFKLPGNVCSTFKLKRIIDITNVFVNWPNAL